MGTIEIVDLSSDDETEKLIPKVVKLEPDYFLAAKRQNETIKGLLPKHQRSQSRFTRQDFEENISSNVPDTSHNNTHVHEHEVLLDDPNISYASHISAAPICRQFWKAGNYADGLGSKVQVQVQNGNNFLHVHPMFLHSNATSHRWAFGAIAELLDNAVDEIQNGASFVIVDKTSNPKDGSPALLIQDDGGGMDPEGMRRCLSFGFSDKKSKFAIGRYGNGFKTSSMRLGADVIVFSNHLNLNNGILTQSIGLLSYTFLMLTQLDRIVVPMVNYKFNTSTGSWEILNGKEYFVSNLSLILKWSPYSSEEELLKQFEDIGPHGTKVIIYNLWFNDDGNPELDFDMDPEDVRIAGDIKKVDALPAWRTINEQHIANRYRYSLRVYMSILYLRIPESFQMILRGKIVKPHNIADDLKYPEYILYQPQVGGVVEASIVTTIGFLKEAPHVNIHGFNLYHKNRLIMPFWQVVRYSDSRGRGVVGILQADFIEPTHDKQDFERTSLFQKLEGRLKEMTWEYWDYHCVLLGYQEKKKHPDRAPAPAAASHVALQKPLGSNNKRKTNEPIGLLKLKKHAREEDVTSDSFHQNKPITAASADHLLDQETKTLLQEKKKLQAECMEYVKREEELNIKVMTLRSKIQDAHRQYNMLLAELRTLDVKNE